MSVVSIALVVLGCAAVAAMVVDIFWTAVAVGMGSGPISRSIGRTIWKAARRFDGRRSSEPVGYLVVAGTLAGWVFLSWLGLFLIFLSQPDAVVHASTGQPASTLARAAYSAGALAGAGAGYVAGRPVFELVNNVGAVTGLVFVALAASHVVSLTNAVVGSRQTAVRITGLGGSPEEIVRACTAGGSLEGLPNALLQLSEGVAASARHHLAYPELKYFRASDRRSAIQVGVGILDELLTLMECGAAEPLNPAVTRTLRSAIGDFIETAEKSPEHSEPPPLPSLEALRASGVATTDQATYQRNARAYDGRRRSLHAVLIGSGWGWQDISDSNGMVD